MEQAGQAVGQHPHLDAAGRVDAARHQVSRNLSLLPPIPIEVQQAADQSKGPITTAATFAVHCAKVTDGSSRTYALPGP